MSGGLREDRRLAAAALVDEDYVPFAPVAQPVAAPATAGAPSVLGAAAPSVLCAAAAPSVLCGSTAASARSTAALPALPAVVPSCSVAGHAAHNRRLALHWMLRSSATSSGGAVAAVKAAVDTSAAKAAEQGLRATWGESGVLVTTKANVAGGLVLGDSVLVSRGGVFWRFVAAQMPKEAKSAQACIPGVGLIVCEALELCQKW